MTPAEVIREARNLLFEDGWAQGAFGTSRGEPHCIRGACLVAAGPMHLWNGWTHGTCPPAVDEALAAATGDSAVPGMRFNDTPGRTFDEVVDLLDRAEKIAESREVSL